MKNTSKSKSDDIFQSIKKEQEAEENAKNTSVEISVNNEEQVKPAIKSPETLAKSTDQMPQPQSIENTAPVIKYAERPSTNPGINYSEMPNNQVEPTINNGLLYITPTRKKIRRNRKGFLLSDLALQNLQKEATKYEISENELINQILEKMI